LTAHVSREGGREDNDLVFTGAKGTPPRRSFALRTFGPAAKRAALDPALTFTASVTSPRH